MADPNRDSNKNQGIKRARSDDDDDVAGSKQAKDDAEETDNDNNVMQAPQDTTTHLSARQESLSLDENNENGAPSSPAYSPSASPRSSNDQQDGQQQQQQPTVHPLDAKTRQDFCQFADSIFQAMDQDDDQRLATLLRNQVPASLHNKTRTRTPHLLVTDSFGVSMALYAAAHEKWKCLSTLIQYKTDFQGATNSTTTNDTMASSNNNPTTTKPYFDPGFDAICEQTGRTVLHYTIHNQQIPISFALVTNGWVDMEHVDEYQMQSPKELWQQAKSHEFQD